MHHFLWSRFALPIAFLSASMTSAAQEDALWSRFYNGPTNGPDVVSDLAIDAAGNTYLAGVSSLTGTVDMVVAKYGSGGALKWVTFYDGLIGGYDAARAVAVDGKGNVYVTGTSERATGQDYATLKLDSNGHILWVSYYDGPASQYDEAHAIALDGNGNAYVTGTSYDTGFDVATVKYGPNGKQLWARRLNSPENGDESGDAIAIGTNGNVYVTGTPYTAMYDAAGVRKWARRYQDPNFQEGWWAELEAIGVDSAGNAYVTGDVRTPNYVDYVTIKYDVAGARKWLRYYDGPYHGGDYARALVLDGQANVTVTGMSQADGNSTNDYATVQYDTNGHRNWVARYDGQVPDPYVSDDKATSIALSPDGSYWVFGSSYFYVTSTDAFGTDALLRYDANGHLLTARHYPLASPGLTFNQAVDVGVDSFGDPRITGTLWNGSANSFDILVAKYAP